MLISVPLKPGDKPKRTAPTTVRFSPELLAWLRSEGAKHPDGVTGVINDAVAEYRNTRDSVGRSMIRGIFNAP